jgi:hypothetical protein
MALIFLYSFTFLEQDGIPWHNNTAERAIRHLARQREIPGSFHESGARDYLILLGIRQTCRSQGKSFFKFLLSEETDLDHFASRKRQRKKRELLLTSRYLGAPLAPLGVLDHSPLGEI